MLTLSLDTLRRLFGVARDVRHSQSFSATRPAERVAGADLIYRLKAWPQLPEAGRTAEIYRMLSVMSQRPVNRQWILSCTRLDPQQLDALLSHLVQEGALEVIDPARFAGNAVSNAS